MLLKSDGHSKVSKINRLEENVFLVLNVFKLVKMFLWDFSRTILGKNQAITLDCFSHNNYELF